MFVEKMGYIVSRQTRDVDGYIEMSLFIKTPEGTVKVLPDRQLSVFFTNAPLASLPQDVVGVQCTESHYRSFDNVPVVLVQSHSLTLHQQMLNFVKQNGYAVFEEDIKAHNRYLMERNIRGAVRFIGIPDASEQVFRQARVIPSDWQPEWKVWSLDIETSVSSNTLLSIGITAMDQRVAFVVTEQSSSSSLIQRFSDEKSLLLAFIRFVKKHSPDIFIGWNLIGFDLQFIDQRCQALGIRPAFGVNGESWSIRSSDNQGKYFASIPGRVALDGITLLKVGGYHFESYSLNHVSQEILDDGKLLHGSERWQEIERLHKEDLDAFVAYNLQDCDLVMRIFEKLKLIELQQTRVDLTGIPLEQTGGSVAAFENLYLPRLHSAGWVAPAWSNDDFVASPGGFVMSSIPGLYKNVLVFDFKSLYPSIMQTFYIDPLGLIEGLKNPNHSVQGFNKALFSRDKHHLPLLIKSLASQRQLAKDNQDQMLSQAIKIIMNSLYGVLGSKGCRFYDPRLSSSITLRGHEIMLQTKKWIEELGYSVIYGDTDSTFIKLDNDLTPDECNEIGAFLAKKITTDWVNEIKQTHNLTSHLEIEFENQL